MFITPHITITSLDLRRLHQLITVVTMNSIVTFEDIASGYKRTVRLVYPEHADSSWDRVSILSPLGSALLGLRVGQEFDWILPQGKRRVRILEVPYQPEASGDFSL